MIFYVFPSSLQLRLIAQGGGGGASSVTNPSPAPLSQGMVVDDASRVAWNARSLIGGPGGAAYQCPDPRGGYTHGNAFRLMAIPPATILQPHGPITKVEIVARIYRSNNGADDWCGRGTGFPSPPGSERDVNAFICPWYDISGADPTGAGTLPASSYRYQVNFHRYVEFPRQTYSGFEMVVGDGPAANHHNFALSASVNPATPKEIAWDITAKRGSWDDPELVAARWGLAAHNNQGGFVAGTWFESGVPQGANNAGSTPRWNVSQFALRVTADPPPGGDAVIFMDE